MSRIKIRSGEEFAELVDHSCSEICIALDELPVDDVAELSSLLDADAAMLALMGSGLLLSIAIALGTGKGWRMLQKASIEPKGERQAAMKAAGAVIGEELLARHDYSEAELLIFEIMGSPPLASILFQVALGACVANELLLRGDERATLLVLRCMVNAKRLISARTTSHLLDQTLTREERRVKEDICVMMG